MTYTSTNQNALNFKISRENVRFQAIFFPFKEQSCYTALLKIKKAEQNFQIQKYHKLQQSKNKIIPLSHIIILKNEKQNKQTYTTIEKDYKLCKKYGYKLTKICTVRMNDITQTLAILNAKIKIQTKQNTEILLREQLPKNTKLRYKNKKTMKETKFPKQYLK